MGKERIPRSLAVANPNIYTSAKKFLDRPKNQLADNFITIENRLKDIETNDPQKIIEINSLRDPDCVQPCANLSKQTLKILLSQITLSFENISQRIQDNSDLQVYSGKVLAKISNACVRLNTVIFSKSPAEETLDDIRDTIKILKNLSMDLKELQLSVDVSELLGKGLTLNSPLPSSPRSIDCSPQ